MQMRVVNSLISFVYSVLLNILMTVHDLGLKKSWVLVPEFGSLAVEGGSAVSVSNLKHFLARYRQNTWSYLFGSPKRDCKLSNTV